MGQGTVNAWFEAIIQEASLQPSYLVPKQQQSCQGGLGLFSPHCQRQHGSTPHQAEWNTCVFQSPL